MSNKKIFKELYSKKINKTNNYKSILERIENEHMKSNLSKKILIPICSFMVICGLIGLNLDEKSNTLNLSDVTTSQNKDYEIYLNNNTDENSYSSNIDFNLKDANYKEIINQEKYSFLKELKIPNDLDNIEYKEIYVKENINSSYNVLYNYQFNYQNNNDRNIILSFSDKYQPLRNYIYSEENKSKINNIDVIIYQSKNSYIAIFIFNNINFDIETNNITKEELINLLTSITK